MTADIFQPLQNNRYRIPKSRYDSVDLYISTDWINRPEYNDSYSPYDASIYGRLRKHGAYDVHHNFFKCS